MSFQPPYSLWASFRAAFAGLVWAWQSQRNFRIHSVLALVALGLGTLIQLERWEWGLLFMTIGLVLAGELFNTALEAVVDLASPEWHELAKRAKDTAAAGVLVLALAAMLIGVVLALPRFLTYLGT
jgi:diacylglycerol kinase